MTRPLQDIGLSVKRLQTRHHRAIDSALAPLDTTLAQWDALRHMSQNPGASLHELAALTFQTDQSFGALASRMIARELIERVPGPGKAIRHTLTDRGLELRVAGDRVVSDVLAASFGRLSPLELEEFDRLLLVLSTAPAEVTRQEESPLRPHSQR